jgi:hypothetical protein
MLKPIILATLAAAVVADMDMDFGCIAKHCAGAMAKAAVDPTFWKSSKCELGCNDVYDEDTTPEKLVYQNCTTICALTYESPAGDEFLACAMTNDCVTFPAIPGSCPTPEVDQALSLASMEGEWWQHRGKNALWDCYPCQHIHSMFLVDDADWCAQTNSPVGGPVAAPCWNYTYSYDLYVQDDGTNGGTKYFGQSWQLPADIPAGEAIDIYYNYMGSYHNETWYLLDSVEDRYILLVDCSYMNTWIDVGSIVWVRPGVELTDAENARIAKVYEDKLGWSYDDFCYDRHGDGNCDGPDGVLVSHGSSERIPAPPKYGKARQPVYNNKKMLDDFKNTVAEFMGLD